MLNVRTIVLLAAGLLVVLGMLSGCSNDTGPKAEASEMPALAPTLVFLDLAQAGSRTVAVGEAGAIRISDNNGDTWQAVPSGVNETLTAVTFANDQKGWAVGHKGILLRTDDGGNQWARVELTGQIDPDQALMDIAFDNNNQGVIVGTDRLILTTSDNGESWVREHLDVGVYGSNLNSAAILESGHLLIVTDGSEILSRANADAQWQVSREGSMPLLGILGLGGSEALAFGHVNRVLHSQDGGVSWATVNSISKVGYFDGRLLSDGSVVLVGSEGIVARRAVGGDTFYPEQDLALGALTGVVEGENGRLILTGIQGVGYYQNGRYWFHGIENGTTGQLVARQLLSRVELWPLFDVVETGRGYYSRQDINAAEWVEISFSAAGEGQDVLTSDVFNAIGIFIEFVKSEPQLPLTEPWSIWDSRYFSYVVLQGPYGHVSNYPMVPGKPAYTGAERPYLERRIQQAALPEQVITADRQNLTVFASVPSAVVAHNDGVKREAIHAFLSSLNESPAGESRTFRVSSINTARIEEVQPDPVDESEAGRASGHADYFYVITRNGETSYYCEKAEILALADSLAGYLKTEGAPGQVLSVADQAKLNQVSRKNENWKWYTTSGYDEYGNEVYRLWNQSYCPNPLAIVFGHPGGENQSKLLEGLVEQFGESADLSASGEQLEVKAYRVERASI